MSYVELISHHENQSVFEGLQNSSKKDKNPTISFHKPTNLNFSKVYETIFLNLWQETYHHIS